MIQTNYQSKSLFAWDTIQWDLGCVTWFDGVLVVSLQWSNSKTSSNLEQQDTIQHQSLFGGCDINMFESRLAIFFDEMGSDLLSTLWNFFTNFHMDLSHLMWCKANITTAIMLLGNKIHLIMQWQSWNKTEIWHFRCNFSNQY